MVGYSLVGIDGNAYCIIGYTARAMRREGFSKEEIDEMYEKAQSSDYNNLLCVCMDYIEKVNKKIGAEDSD